MANWNTFKTISLCSLTPSAQVQLYDVESDPSETQEVSAKNPDIVNMMLERLDYYQSRVSIFLK